MNIISALTIKQIERGYFFKDNNWVLNTRNANQRAVETKPG